MNLFKYISLGLLLTVLVLSSCTPAEDCKNCEVVTYSVSSGDELYRESAIEYCGPLLDEKEDAEPVISGDERIVWECN